MDKPHPEKHMTEASDNKTIFDGLVILEMSKNHAGDVEHGKQTVKEFSSVVQKHGVKAAVKLQFRDLETYIHPEYQGGSDERMQRYYSSHLTEQEFSEIVEEIRASGLITISTPFDEPSVDMLDRLGVEMIKIASSSSDDWPLIERVIKSNKPIICSVGGQTIEEIDKLVDVLQKNAAVFSLLHCVGMYPTEDEAMQLNRIDFLKQRYAGVPIGFSTHESPEKTNLVQMAYAKGAELYEKHIILLNDEIENEGSYTKVLGYSATPQQLDEWLTAFKHAESICGSNDQASYTPTQKELDSLRTMKRGVYASRSIKKGELLSKENVFFAIPLSEGQMSTKDWTESMFASKNFNSGEAIC